MEKEKTWELPRVARKKLNCEELATRLAPFSFPGRRMIRVPKKILDAMYCNNGLMVSCWCHQPNGFGIDGANDFKKKKSQPSTAIKLRGEREGVSLVLYSNAHPSQVPKIYSKVRAYGCISTCAYVLVQVASLVLEVCWRP